MTQPTSSPPRGAGSAAAKKRSRRRPLGAGLLIGALTITLPLLIFLAASAVYLSRVYKLVRYNLTPIVASEASRDLGREVRLGNLSLMPLGKVTLDRLSISDGPSFTNNTPALASAREIVVHYNVDSILFDPADAAHAVGNVEVSSPTLRIARLPDHSFNFSSIFANKTPTHHRPFVGTVAITGGSLRFQDYLAPAIPHAPPAVNRLTEVNATINFSSEDRVVFRADGSGTPGGNLQHITVRGSASRLKGSEYALFLNAKQARLSYWATYFKDFPQFHVASGLGDGRIGLVRANRASQLDLTGDIAYRNAMVVVTDKRIVAAPIIGLTGQAHFNNASVQTTGSFVLNGQQVRATGMLYDFAHPQIEAAASLVHADLPSVEAAIPSIRLPEGITSAPLAAQISFSGGLSKPAIGATVSTPSVVFSGHTMTAFQARGVFYDHVLVVPIATCTFPNGGTGQATLTIDGSTGVLQVRAGGVIHGYDLAELLPGALQTHAALHGRADFDFIADNRAGPLALTANMHSKGFIVHGVEVAEAAGRLTWANGGAIFVQRFVGRSPLGTVALSGEVPAKPFGEDWGLAIDATGLDVGPIARGFIAEMVQGVGNFHGTLTGPVSDPKVAGSLQVSGGRYGNLTADAVAGRFVYTQNTLTLQNVDLRRYPTEATVSGSITGLQTAAPAANLLVAFQHADLEDITALARQVQLPATPNSKLARGVGEQMNEALSTLTGTAEGSLHISGHLSNPRVSGQTVITDATLGAYRVDRARADFNYGSGILKIKNGLVSIEDADITASGSYNTRTTQVDGVFAATNFDLDKFKRYFGTYASVSGTVAFSGSITGNLSSFSVSAGLIGQQVNLDGQHLADFDVFARYQDGLITQTGGPWTFTVDRPAQPNVPAGQTSYDITAFNLELPTPAAPSRPVTLSMTADIPQGAPETVRHIVSTIGNSTLANTPAGRAILSAYDRMPQPFAADLSASSIKLSGPLDNLSVDASVHVSSLTIASTRAQNIDVTVDSVAGSKRSTSLNATADNVEAAGVPLDKVSLVGSMNGSVISVTTLKATSDQTYLSAQGRADLDGDIDATLDASGIPLSTFDPFLPSAKELTGELSSFSAAASGPTRMPDLTASITLEGPALTLRNAVASQTQVYALDRVRSGAITLKTIGNGGERLLAVSNLTAYKDHQPVASLSGSIPLKWTNGVIPVLDVPESQSVAAKFTVYNLGAFAAISPLIDPLRTSGSLTATLSSSPDSPNTLMGQVQLDGGSFALAGFSTSLEKMQVSADFNASGFHIEQFGAQSSDGGTMSLTGGGTFGDRPAVSMTMLAKEFVVSETSPQTLLSKLYSSSFRGKINGTVKIDGPAFSPEISTKLGDPILVTEASGTIPTPPATTSSSTPVYPIDPEFGLVIQVGEKAKPAKIQKSSLITAEVSGEVDLGGRLSAPVVGATFYIYKGQVLIPPSTPLKLVSPYGEVDIKYPVLVTDDAGQVIGALQTNVDLYAQAKVSVRPSTLAAYQSIGQGSVNTMGQQASIVPGSALDTPVRYTINAYIHGVLGDPDNFHIELSSEPADLNTDQMYAAIGGYSGLLSRDPQLALQDQMNSILSGVLLPGVFQPFETGVENALGLDVFSVDYSNGEPLSLTVTKNLTDHFSVTYTQLIGQRATPVVTSTEINPLYTIELSYALSRRLQLSVTTDSLHNNAVQLQGTFGFH